MQQEFRDVFGDAQGQRVLAHLMRFAGFYEPYINGLSAEAHRERRNVILFILKALHGDKIEEEHDEILQAFKKTMEDFK